MVWGPVDRVGVDGYTLCKKIKEDPDLGNPVVIAISGLLDAEEDRILSNGADAFWIKPFDGGRLAEAIEKKVGERQE